MPDVELKIIIREQNIQRVLDSFSTIAGKDIEIIISDHEYHIRRSAISQPQQPGETIKQYGERIVRDYILSLVKMTELAEDQARYSAEISAIEPVSQNTPDDIIE
jgi:hypothetical protein